MKTTTKSLLQLVPLQKLERQNFDLHVLLAMEADALHATHQAMELNSETITRESLLEKATSHLPKDAKLLQAYTETGATLASRPVRELERVAHLLSHCARTLEREAVTVIAGIKNTGDFAKAQEQMGPRLAALLQSANSLETSGGMIATQSNARRLESVINFVQSGPLSKFLDKARVLLAQREGVTDSMSERMSPAGA